MTASITEMVPLGVGRLVNRQIWMHEHHIAGVPKVIGFENSVPLAVLGEQMVAASATLSQSSPLLERHGSFQDLPLVG